VGVVWWSVILYRKFIEGQAGADMSYQDLDPEEKSNIIVRWCDGSESVG
jgi:hypothetical protein